MILPCRGSEPTLCSGPSLTDSCSYYRPPLAGKLPVNSHRNSCPRVPIFPSGSGLAGFPVLRSRPQASDLLPRCYCSRQPGASRLGRAGVAVTALSQAADHRMGWGSGGCPDEVDGGERGAALVWDSKTPGLRSGRDRGFLGSRGLICWWLQLCGKLIFDGAWRDVWGPYPWWIGDM